MSPLRTSWLALKRLIVALGAITLAVCLFKFALLPLVEFVFRPDEFVATLLRRSGMLIAAVLGYWSYVRHVEKRAVAELRVTPVGIAIGIVSGAALISITTLSLFALGAYEMTAYRGLQGGLPGVAGVILVAAMLEEIVFRGVLFRILQDACGMVPALWLGSLIFALLHLGNLDAGVGTLELITTVVAATLISAFWTLVFVRSRNLWVVGTHHAAWNFSILLSGAPLSGVEEWRAMAPIETQYHGAQWLTGGVFGPEDSIITIVVMAICLAVMLRPAKPKKTSGLERTGAPDSNTAPKQQGSGQSARALAG